MGELHKTTTSIKSIPGIVYYYCERRITSNRVDKATENDTNTSS